MTKQIFTVPECRLIIEKQFDSVANQIDIMTEKIIMDYLDNQDAVDCLNQRRNDLLKYLASVKQSNMEHIETLDLGNKESDINDLYDVLYREFCFVISYNQLAFLVKTKSYYNDEEIEKFQLLVNYSNQRDKYSFNKYQKRNNIYNYFEPEWSSVNLFYKKVLSMIEQSDLPVLELDQLFGWFDFKAQIPDESSIEILPIPTRRRFDLSKLIVTESVLTREFNRSMYNYFVSIPSTIKEICLQLKVHEERTTQISKVTKEFKEHFANSSATIDSTRLRLEMKFWSKVYPEVKEDLICFLSLAASIFSHIDLELLNPKFYNEVWPKHFWLTNEWLNHIPDIIDKVLKNSQTARIEIKCNWVSFRNDGSYSHQCGDLPDHWLCQELRLSASNINFRHARYRQLSILHIDAIHLDRLQENTLVELTALKQLSLESSSSQFGLFCQTEYDWNFMNPFRSSLETLHISFQGNEVLSYKAFERLSNLRTLHIECKDPIKPDSGGHIFRDLNQLHNLQLSISRDMPANFDRVFKPLDKLVELKLTGLTACSMFTHNTVQNNSIQRLFLDLSSKCNKLVLESKHFEYCPNLQQISLLGSNIQLTPKIFSQMKKLRELKLYDLSLLDVESCDQLEKLDLDPAAFEGQLNFPNVKFLSSSRCGKLDLSILDSFPQLKIVAENGEAPSKERIYFSNLYKKFVLIKDFFRYYE